MALQVWLAAFRLRTLPLALSCVLMGALLAAEVGMFRWSIFVLCSLTTVCLQILSNLANDYGDTIHGADSEMREGPVRMVQAGKISRMQIKIALFAFVLLSLFFGILLLVQSQLPFRIVFLFFCFGLLAVGAAVWYTMGAHPYGYAGFGDLSVFVFFGWLGVMGTYYLMTKRMDWLIVLPASSCSFFAVAVLNLNNIRDIKSDQLVGKYSIPVRIGRKLAVVYHRLLLFAGLFCAVLYVVLSYQSPIQFLFLLVTPLLWKNIVAVQKHSTAMELDPYLKQLALMSLFFTLSFGFGQLLA